MEGELTLRRSNMNTWTSLHLSRTSAGRRFDLSNVLQNLKNNKDKEGSMQDLEKILSQELWAEFDFRNLEAWAEELGELSARKEDFISEYIQVLVVRVAGMVSMEAEQGAVMAKMCSDAPGEGSSTTTERWAKAGAPAFCRQAAQHIFHSLQMAKVFAVAAAKTDQAGDKRLKKEIVRLVRNMCSLERVRAILDWSPGVPLTGTSFRSGPHEIFEDATWETLKFSLKETFEKCGDDELLLHWLASRMTLEEFQRAVATGRLVGATTNDAEEFKNKLDIHQTLATLVGSLSDGRGSIESFRDPSGGVPITREDVARKIRTLQTVTADNNQFLDFLKTGLISALATDVSLETFLTRLTELQKYSNVEGYTYTDGSENRQTKDERQTEWSANLGLLKQKVNTFQESVQKHGADISEKILKLKND